MPRNKTFFPLLPQVRAHQQADRCGGALPSTQVAGGAAGAKGLPPLVQGARGWRQWFDALDVDEQEVAVVFGGSGPLSDDSSLKQIGGSGGVSNEPAQWHSLELGEEDQRDEACAAEDSVFGWWPSPPPGPPPAAEKRRVNGRPPRQHAAPAPQTFGSSQRAPQIALSKHDDHSNIVATQRSSAADLKPGFRSTQGNQWKSGRSWRQPQRKTTGSPWRKAPGPRAKGQQPGPHTTGSWLHVHHRGKSKHMVPEGLCPIKKAQDTLMNTHLDQHYAHDDHGPLLPSELIENEGTLQAQAFQSSQPVSELPDVHRVIWRGAALLEASEGKSFEDLELARHRRDKVREAGEEQRQKARERFQVLEEKERRYLQAKRKEKQDQRWEIEHPNSDLDDDENSEDGFIGYSSQMSFNYLSVASAGRFAKPQLISPDGSPGRARKTLEAGDEQPSVLHNLTPNQTKPQRLAQVQNLHRSRRRQERLGRLLEARQRDFLSKPESEQLALRSSFQRADVGMTDALDSAQLRRALEELGLAPKNDVEKKEMQVICDEVGIIGDVDFFTFCSEAVPRARERLRDMRRGPLLQQFKIYDSDNSGYLDVEECEQILSRNYTFSLDDQGQQLMRASFNQAIKQAVCPDIGEVDFDGFEALMALLQEHYQRILLERETAIMNEEGLTTEDVKEHHDELVSLYDSFSRGDFDGNAGMDIDELRPLLLEYGLYPRSIDGQKRIESVFTLLDADRDGSLDFKQFLSMIRSARQIFKLSQASELQHLFEKFDTRHDNKHHGTIDMGEVSSLLGDLGLTPRCRDDQQEMKRILDGMTTCSGQVTFNEFQTLVLRVTEHSNAAQRRRERQCAAMLSFADDQVAELRDAFDTLDAEDHGVLSIDKLRTALDLLRKDLSADDLQTVIEALDPGATGGLGFEQFLHFMHLVN